MLGWLILRTRGQVWATFRPTRGRIIGAFCLAMVAPVVVFSWIPWIIGGFLGAMIGHAPLQVLGIAMIGTAMAYPLAAMIIRHTYQRRVLRFGLFALSFWTAYALHMLWRGAERFTL